MNQKIMKRACLMLLGVCLLTACIGCSKSDGNGKATSTPTPEPIRNETTNKYNTNEPIDYLYHLDDQKITFFGGFFQNDSGNSDGIYYTISVLNGEELEELYQTDILKPGAKLQSIMVPYSFSEGDSLAFMIEMKHEKDAAGTVGIIKSILVNIDEEHREDVAGAEE